MKLHTIAGILLTLTACTTVNVNRKDCTTYRDNEKGVVVVVCADPHNVHYLPIREK